MAPLRAILYAAKSTEDKRGSIAAQLADCRALALREGFEIVEEYVDEAVSAWKGNRGPGLEAALKHVEKIRGVLVVQHSDRLARGDGIEARHLAEIFFATRRAGVTVRSVQDDSTFSNPLLAVALGERNAEDSRRKSLAVKSGKRRAWARGDFPGGPTPDGFDRIGRNKARLDPERIDLIRLIGDLADQGWGEPSIARELNRRGHRTKGGDAWTRRRIQDLMTNPVYYGGIAWRRGAEDEEINWATEFPAPWTRQDFERRMGARAERDLGRGAHARGGHPHTNHALAGLAACGLCLDRWEEIVPMRPITSSYRRKDGSRRRTYLCRHVKDGTGLCYAPAVDAELVDSHVINQLKEYLGDFEAWREQLLSGYTNERQRLEKELADAGEDIVAQETICERTDRAIGLAETDDEIKAATRAAGKARQELERRQRRLEAAHTALSDVPDEVPADAMLDFYNELSAAVRGRLEGANTVARINDALKDLFSEFFIQGAPRRKGVLIFPVANEGLQFRLRHVEDIEPIKPPLRAIEAPSAQLVNAQL